MAQKVKGPVRVAMIGVGGITGAHAVGFRKNPDKLRCVAMVDLVSERMEKRSTELGSTEKPRFFNDWKVMLKEMGDGVDAVDIALPHHLHAAAILDAVHAGKHVICEKPMCMNLSEADQIEKAVAKAGVTYMSGHNQLFMPVVREAKRMIDAGEIGRVLLIRSQDCFRCSPDNFKGTWRSKLATQGGGELIDTGYHPTYRMLYLAGSKVASVQGQMGRFHVNLEGDDCASVHVRFENGTLGEVLTSWCWDNPYGSYQIHVLGEKGQIFGDGDTLYHLPQGFTEPAKRKLEGMHEFQAEFAHLADCLIEGKRPLHSVEEGRAVLEVILKAAETARGWERSAWVKP